MSQISQLQNKKEPLRSLHLDLPIKTVSRLNTPEHWSKTRKRNKKDREELYYEWKNAVKGQTILLPCRITLTRVGVKLLDDDNLRSAFKALRDEICRIIGVDDSPSSPVQFSYKQETMGKGKREYRIRIDVESV